MSFKGEESSPGGQLPDPSTRHWRHPSELGSLGVGPGAAPTMQESGLGPMMWFGVLTVGAVAGVLVAVSLSGLTFLGGGGLTVSDGELAEAVIISPAQSTSTTTVAIAPPSPADSEPKLWSAERPITADPDSGLTSTGVFASRNETTRLASYVAVDGMVLTSLAAVGSADPVSLRVGGRWVDAEIVAADSYTDVAVLGPLEPIDETLVEFTGVASRPAPATNVRVEFSASDLVDGGQGEIGIVGEAGETVVIAGTNRYCYDAFITSLPSWNAPPGSALVDDDGAVVGMTISTNRPTAAAIPITVAVDVARAMIDHDVPSHSQLGVKAKSVGDRVLISVVDPSGPAAQTLSVGDTVVSVDGVVVKDPDHLVFLIRQVDSDPVINLHIERDGVVIATSVTPPLAHGR